MICTFLLCNCWAAIPYLGYFLRSGVPKSLKTADFKEQNGRKVTICEEHRGMKKEGKRKSLISVGIPEEIDIGA